MTKKNLIDTSIAFGGFYESIHDSNIDNMIESYNDNGNFPDFVWDNIDYKKTNQSYIESWTSDFSSYLLNEYQVDIDFKNLVFNDLYEEGWITNNLFLFFKDFLSENENLINSKESANVQFEDSFQRRRSKISYIDENKETV